MHISALPTPKVPQSGERLSAEPTGRESPARAASVLTRTLFAPNEDGLRSVAEAGIANS